MEERLNILETAMSAVAFERMNLYFKKESDYKFSDDIDFYGTNKIELILNHFHLPFNFFNWKNYFQLIEKEAIQFDNVKAFIKLIKYRSRVYLTKETKNDIRFIKEAIELEWDFEQLSENLSFHLSVENKPYYWYLYHEILKEKILTPESFLEDIRLAEKIQIIPNINTHKEFFNTIDEHTIDSLKRDENIIYYN